MAECSVQKETKQCVTVEFSPDDIEEILVTTAKKLAKLKNADNVQVDFDNFPGNVRVEIESHIVASGSVAPTVLELLQNEETDFSANEIADRIEVDVQAVRTALVTLNKKGDIERVSKGRYQAAAC